VSGKLDKTDVAPSNRTVKDSLTVRFEGNREVQRKFAYYNLDMIISVVYRFRPQHGIEFRIWATKILKEYILRGYAINQRFAQLENRISKTEEQIDFFPKTI
jgi:hypothetical protein